jgi:hypothetical protein
VSRHRLQRRTERNFARDVAHVLLEHDGLAHRMTAAHMRVDLGEQARILIRDSAEHHAVHMLELFERRVYGREPAVDHDAKLGEVVLEPMDTAVVERRNLAVLLRAQPFEQRLARVDDERVATSSRNARDEAVREFVTVVIVDAEPRLDADGHADRLAHRNHAVRDSLRLQHQRRTEAPGLHAIARTPDVQIDLVVPCDLA